MTKLHNLLATTILLALSAPGPALGQAIFGNISGTVRDPSGSAIASARVIVRDIGKGIDYTATTNESGNYSQTHLIVGLYQVRVEAPGFQSYVQKNVDVE